jgi:hypothetical protein
MNVKVQNWILKSKTLILKQVQNDIHLMPNLFRHLIWTLDLN